MRAADENPGMRLETRPGFFRFWPTSGIAPLSYLYRKRTDCVIPRALLPLPFAQQCSGRSPSALSRTLATGRIAPVAAAPHARHEVQAMFFHTALEAIRTAEFFALKSKLPYAIYTENAGFIVRLLTQPTGAELETFHP
jgi:hypothetical protein